MGKGPRSTRGRRKPNQKKTHGASFFARHKKHLATRGVSTRSQCAREIPSAVFLSRPHRPIYPYRSEPFAIACANVTFTFKMSSQITTEVISLMPPVSLLNLNQPGRDGAQHALCNGKVARSLGEIAYVFELLIILCLISSLALSAGCSQLRPRSHVDGPPCILFGRSEACTF